MSDHDEIKVSIARVEERVRADRKSFAIYSQHVSGELVELKNMLKQHFVDEEEKHLQIKQEISDYKDKMYYWEVFQNWKRLPFWTFCAVFFVAARPEIKTLIDHLIKKITGL